MTKKREHVNCSSYKGRKQHIGLDRLVADPLRNVLDSAENDTMCT